MRADAMSVTKLLYAPAQYIVPFFQRHYSWDQVHWARLWEDIEVLIADGDQPRVHFLGPLVCTPTDVRPGEVPGYQLIDGQQRLTTLIVLLAALRDVAISHGEAELAEQINDNYLTSKFRKGLQRYKVVPRIGDREILKAVVDRQVTAAMAASGIVRARRYFEGRIRGCVQTESGADLQRIFLAATDQLALVAITIDDENPYEIFESLNSTGLPLEEADLIRNYIFMQVPLRDQDEFNAEVWSPFESLFTGANDRAAIPATAFYRNYVMRNGEYSRSNATFVDFKAQARASETSPAELVTDLREWSRYELMTRHPSAAESPAVRARLKSIAALDIGTASPLIMSLLHGWQSNELSEAELVGCFHDLESFVLRRSICGESTRPYHRWFASAIRDIKRSPRTELQAYWGKRGWPSDERFEKALLTFPLYSRERTKCRLILETLEAQDSKETVDFSSLSIEHIMPQTIGDDENGQAWKEMLGPDWQRVHDDLGHVLGNLTLTGYNPELSNRPFSWKRLQYAQSNVEMNRLIARRDAWTEDCVDERGRALASKVIDLWARPELIPDVPGTGATPPPDEDPYERYLDFWTAFSSRMEERGSGIRLPRPMAQYYMEVRLGRSGVAIVVECSVKKGRASVYLYLSDKQNANSHFEALRDQHRKEIEEDLGGELDWVAPEDHEYRAVSVGRDSYIADRNSWPELIEWLATKLEAMHTAFAPLVKDLGGASKLRAERTGGGLSNTKVKQLDFWTQFSAFVAERDPKMRMQTPRPQHWHDVTIGTSEAHISLTVNTRENCLAAELYIPDSKPLFFGLRTKEAEIEERLGASPEWIEAVKATRIKLTKPVPDVFLDSRQEEYFRWLYDQVVLLKRTFIPLIRQVPRKSPPDEAATE